ncbi:MAG TPA: NYN domain-containing protein [Bryobacteraceae bacterium]|nr:NYN domain-containing protein [Bryobacteraceae bacterium]
MSNVKMPGKRTPERVIVYIDGFNLYYGIRGSGLGRYLWLNLCSFSQKIIKPHQELRAVRYFTSRVAKPESKRKRQSAYLEALQTLDRSMLSITYGNYQSAPFKCRHCARHSEVQNEKQTDVNIAVAMLVDAFRDRFDKALLVSADSDLCPAIEAVHCLFPAKRVVVCFPPGRASKELAKVSGSCYRISRATLRQCQMPPIIETANGFKLRKPEYWDSPAYQRPH